MCRVLPGFRGGGFFLLLFLWCASIAHSRMHVYMQVYRTSAHKGRQTDRGRRDRQTQTDTETETYRDTETRRQTKTDTDRLRQTDGGEGGDGVERQRQKQRQTAYLRGLGQGFTLPLSLPFAYPLPSRELGLVRKRWPGRLLGWKGHCKSGGSKMVLLHP